MVKTEELSRIREQVKTDEMCITFETMYDGDILKDLAPIIAALGEGVSLRKATVTRSTHGEDDVYYLSFKGGNRHTDPQKVLEDVLHIPGTYNIRRLIPGDTLPKSLKRVPLNRKRK